MYRKLAPALILLALLLAARGAAAVHLSFSTGDGIELHDDWVVITPDDDGGKAEISPGGRLRIDGRWVAVDEKDRLLLVRYNRAVHEINAQAIEVGIEGAGIGVSALGAAVVALLSGGGDAVERHVEPQARRLKEKAKRLCREVQRLQRIQDDLAADVPAFRPFAMMDEDSEPHCRIDD